MSEDRTSGRRDARSREVGADLLRQVAAAFALEGEYRGAARYGSGHINDTFAALCERGDGPVRYVLQRLNDHVFREPERLMENMARVTAHLHAKLTALPPADRDRRALTLVPARDGRPFHVDDHGHFWRCTRLVERALTVDVVTDPRQAYEGARAFGEFLRLLADLPGPRLHETIPRFHDTPARLAALVEAVAADECHRAAAAGDAVDLALSRADLAHALTGPAGRGALRERITHNDTKLNNVLFDERSGAAICVIDLDTVMPGLVLSDFGDMVRTATNPVPEDHPDPSAVDAVVPMFAALVRGFLAGAGTLLDEVERAHLVTAGKVLTFECGVRFLTDYLRGDRYFRTAREHHNLDRARVQLALLCSLERHEAELEALVWSPSPGRSESAVGG